MKKGLSQKQFEILTCIERVKKQLTQREMAEITGMSLGSVNKMLSSLTEQGYIQDSFITETGMEALEPYRVKRAIFIAAGFGARLAPITLNTPKPLVRVNGKRIIDTLLDAVEAAGIEEIVIVRGYLGEQFDQLKYKYPNIKLIDNPNFNESNNIASALCVKDLFSNAYVLDSDIVLKNPRLIRKYEYQTNLLGVPVERTDDWCVKADKNGYADTVSVGGLNGFREVGIFYLDKEDGEKLSHDLEEVYTSPGGRERLWEQVPLVYKKSNYKVAVRQCSESDFVEIDTFSELKKIDKVYEI